MIPLFAVVGKCVFSPCLHPQSRPSLQAFVISFWPMISSSVPTKVWLFDTFSDEKSSLLLFFHLLSKLLMEIQNYLPICTDLIFLIHFTTSLSLNTFHGSLMTCCNVGLNSMSLVISIQLGLSFIFLSSLSSGAMAEIFDNFLPTDSSAGIYHWLENGIFLYANKYFQR